MYYVVKKTNEQLKEGKLKNRNAIRILKLNDYLDELIDETINITQKLE